MRKVRPGDIVLHLTDNEAITGIAVVAIEADDTFVGPEGTEWAGVPAYEVKLHDFEFLNPTLDRKEFLKGSAFEDDMMAVYEQRNGKGLFFNRALELNQGAYLTEAPNELVRILNTVYQKKTDQFLPRLKAFGAVDEQSSPTARSVIAEPYTIDAATEGLFMGEQAFRRILNRLKSKKNIILQGAPGVGKTFVARRLAFALLGEKDEDRVSMVQFHQSYSYEDFVHGYRPTEGGAFELKYGPFWRFCQKARGRPDNDFVFIIDEINRGNLSKVLGELMMLIEADKRSKEWALPLAYDGPDDEKFYVPNNVHLIGMMNTADRSLAVVDYALRRRFSFCELVPCFESDGFRAALVEKGISDRLCDHIISRMSRLNGKITDDLTNLGAGFCIGHSFFCPTHTPSSDADWFNGVVEDEIGPLLREYYFDDTEKAKSLIEPLSY